MGKNSLIVIIIAKRGLVWVISKKLRGGGGVNFGKFFMSLP